MTALARRLSFFANTDPYSIGQFKEENIISHILEMLKNAWQLSFRHVMREANRCADFIAHMGFSLHDEVAILESPPNDLAPLLIQDINGYYCNRDVFARLLGFVPSGYPAKSKATSTHYVIKTCT
ncbi:hypothetical protein POM88_018837 [Heracleum sosnowskyi]|uniref:RNase H type-1 domain-containing protein n=1 Tax=Heracleum sosnowskyi TaxID=360622 RepID=A0AAD8IT69_9APIA|nr:hypothetical protein POM88_018837 [Heracleum sosnowskyi]